MAEKQKTEKAKTQTETSNIAETQLSPSAGASTQTVIGTLPNLDETQSPSPMPLQNGDPVGGGESLANQNESASQTENVNADAAAQNAQGAPESDEGDDQPDPQEKTVKGGEMRIASGIHKGRSVGEDGTINMNSKTEREKRIAAQNRETKEAGTETSDQKAAA